MEFHLLVKLIWPEVKSGFFPSLSVVRHGIGLPLPPLVFWTTAHKMFLELPFSCLSVLTKKAHE